MITATEPVTVTISHRLGRDEAIRRIENALDAIRREIAPFVKSLDYGWDGYRLDFRFSAMLQNVAGRIEVEDALIRVELFLPGLLHLLAKTIAGRIEQRAFELLGPPKG